MTPHTQLHLLPHTPGHTLSLDIRTILELELCNLIPDPVLWNISMPWEFINWDFAFSPLKAWIGREGFARLSNEQFSLSDLSDSRVHLTNSSIQLRSDSGGQGCKWSLRRLREFLTARHGATTVETLVQDIARVVLTSLRCVQNVIIQDRHCFELYGYDVLLDCNLKPWLIEVNASPSMSATSNEDYKLKYTLLQDVLNVLDLEGR
uniref:Tubulin--tyrosine ligase-like protein 9 n=1 Tax=Timema douglasi TaxID=61478 RepID=A0A7R8VR90_TIMDO|nr:unnamed protein product [Timema douglasi]